MLEGGAVADVVATVADVSPSCAHSKRSSVLAGGAVADVVAAVAAVSPRPVASAGRRDARGDGASAGGDSALSTSYWRHTGRLHVSAKALSY
jgi:hypothetical protein